MLSPIGSDSRSTRTLLVDIQIAAHNLFTHYYMNHKITDQKNELLHKLDDLSTTTLNKYWALGPEVDWAEFAKCELRDIKGAFDEDLAQLPPEEIIKKVAGWTREIDALPARANRWTQLNAELKRVPHDHVKLVLQYIADSLKQAEAAIHSE